MVHSLMSRALAGGQQPRMGGVNGTRSPAINFKLTNSLYIIRNSPRNFHGTIHVFPVIGAKIVGIGGCFRGIISVYLGSRE